MSDKAMRELINDYGRACRRDGNPAWESEEGKALNAALAVPIQKPVVKIEHWLLQEMGRCQVLTGHAQEHPRLGNAWVRTSAVLRVDRNARRVETRNTNYELVGDGR